MKKLKIYLAITVFWVCYSFFNSRSMVAVNASPTFECQESCQTGGDNEIVPEDEVPDDGSLNDCEFYGPYYKPDLLSGDPVDGTDPFCNAVAGY